MYCCFVIQGYYPEYFPFKFFNLTPEAKAVVLLRFRFEWILDHSFTPFSLEVRSLSQNLILKISGVFIFTHTDMISKRENDAKT